MNKHVIVVTILSVLLAVSTFVLYKALHVGLIYIPLYSKGPSAPAVLDNSSTVIPNVTSTTVMPVVTPAEGVTDFYIGLTLACSSSIFIGASFIFKKKGLIKLSEQGTRAGDGGYGYLKEPLWWAGLILMAGGECANFAAYAFAPASLVTPLGALSVLVAAVLSSKFLGEQLNLLGKLGCAFSIVGSTVIVIHAPKEQDVQTMQELGTQMLDPGFIVYVVLVAAIAAFLVFYCAPRKGQSNILIYILICSMIGSLSVMGCKGIGLAVKQSFSGDQQFTNWLTYVFIVQVAFCISVQMIYLNRALDTFNTSVVTPIYYVFFTTFVIVAGAVLFKEWSNMSSEDVVGNICGFLTVIGGIFLMNAFKDIDISWNNISNTRRRPTNTEETSTLLSNGSTDIQENGGEHI